MSAEWTRSLFSAFQSADVAQLQLALDASGGQAATHSIYAQASDKPPDLDDSGGYYRLEGTGSGSWYKSQGITAGMSVLEIAEALAAKVPSSAPMPGVVKTWLAKHLSGARSKVTLVAFRNASAHGEAWDVGLSVLLEMKLATLPGAGIEGGAQSGLETFVSV
jgi:hypothetical protein